MLERQFSAAISLAKIMFNAREDFLDALRSAAVLRINSNRPKSLKIGSEIRREIVTRYADETLDAIYRDGLHGLEHNVRQAVDEIVREGLGHLRKRQ